MASLCVSMSRRLLVAPSRLPPSLRPPGLGRTHTHTMSGSGGVAAGSRAVGLWLASCSGLVAGAVVIGGVTRLTESGLSMVDWRLLKDMRPPSSQQEWQREFDRYKEFPEFSAVHPDFTVHDFKRIYYMEYAHRMWGRLIGIAYFLPLGYFIARGRIPKHDYKRHAVFSALLLGQGFYGWYMVKSGLEPKPDSTDIPRVSQYRLAGHLSLAFLLYAGYFWNAMDHLKSELQFQASPNLLRFRMMAHVSKGMVFVTALSGAFVAGLDAGLIYNSFPKMGIYWVPPEILYMTPKWKNFFENNTTVQFDHRMLGMTTLGLVTATCVLARPGYTPLPRRARFAADCLMGVLCGQVAMGIGSLLLYVPVWLAAAHQSGALASLSVALFLTHDLRPIKKLARK